ncbi:predicted protein [Arabidopsis lyrata subsp. lyrata]|uniref:Predicted protein n=1 Tax=Arabidopsis lyrata subsp. lyrata TaxID=81972 RepID=D7L3G8_ARALL|nr:predicted protein [Arabidopsis lyrata subsp. lyrata]
MVELEYEKLEKHCFHCFSLLHEKKDYPVRTEGSRRASPEARCNFNKVNTPHGLENSERREVTKKAISSDARGQRFDSSRRKTHHSPSRRQPRSTPYHSSHKDASRSVFAGILRDHHSGYGNRAPLRRSPQAYQRRDSQAPQRVHYSSRRGHDPEWRRRRSPMASRSYQATNGSPKTSRRSALRSAASQRDRSPMTPPPETLFLPPPPPISPSNSAWLSSPKSRRPALERISTSIQVGNDGQNPLAWVGESSSPSGRLQDVNIQYLGEEEQTMIGLTGSVHVGSSSNPIHPTLSHRLSIGGSCPTEETRLSALQRVEPAQPTITVSIPAKPLKKRTTIKRKTAASGLPRAARSLLQGASTRKRNTSRPEAAVAARKKLCTEQLPCDKDPVTEPQCDTPALVLIPASKKAKSKVDFQILFFSRC